jgi:hypothetical protein
MGMTLYEIQKKVGRFWLENLGLLVQLNLCFYTKRERVIILKKRERYLKI